MSPPTMWMFADASGTVGTIGTKLASGEWQVLHRRFDPFGSYSDNVTDDAYGPLGDFNDVMKSVTPIWNGHLAQNFYAALDTTYLINGHWFQDDLGRFLSEAPGSSGAGESNLYILNGNDPYVDYNSTGEEPNPFNGLGALGFGFYDALFFGHFDDIIGADGAQQYAAQNGLYYAGLGVGIAANIAIGSYLGLAGGAGNAGRAYVAYNLVGDAVGLYDAASAAHNGTFGGLNAIGLGASLAGLGAFAGGLSRAGRAGRIAGHVDNASQAARTASQLDVNPEAMRSSPVTASAVEGVIPRCFTADTEVLVMLPGTGADLSDQFASAPPVSNDEAKTASGAWFLSGAALVALGIGTVATSLKEKQSTRKRQKELSDLDLLFCDYERMEAAVV